MCNGRIRRRREKEEGEEGAIFKAAIFKGEEGIFKARMTENFRKLMPDIKPQIPEVQKTPTRINVQKSPHQNEKTITKSTPRYHIQTAKTQT